ncbi:quinone oxidoreductase family protein [Undibacterium pigrum]|uniref:NADPH:quinone reductase-like Zn-dependent oxidoreductase n=1 Tax=Undibacterium pigrum TaxID=401470 RepID=A0A318IPL6_9BURK|nr:quinone oxidoreductase [Undibacterium pigrum]PXX37335.1 NADPH:quinone reductase-like Zn-dependent oxidoreductase [Undibacterium pigrum]
MQAIQLFSQGSPEVLELKEIAMPVLKHGEVLVQVDYAGINYADVYQRNGQNPASLPCIPGAEGAGTVVEGNGVLPSGTRVAWLSQPGSYAEYLAIPAWKLIALPEYLSTCNAAAAMLQAVTAQYLCETSYRAQAGDTALVHAGAGGVGLLLTQILKHKAARVISTVSTAEKARLSQAAGADHVVLYTETDFVSAVKDMTQQQGVHVVYDSVGLHTYLASMASLRPLGSLVLFGQSSGNVPPIDPMQLCRQGSLFLTRPTLAHHVADAGSLQYRGLRIFTWLREGILDLRINQIYPLEQAAQAHADLESRQTTGKLLLAVSATARNSLTREKT